jgi:Flp pilus assembly protein protease CpaA
VYYQLLMLASLLLAGYQDARERLVSDYYWIPGIIAAVVAVAFLPSMDFLLVARITLIGVIAFAFTWFGFIGQADAIALTLISSDPTPYAPIPVLLATGVVSLAHIGYLYATGTTRKPKLITLQEFRTQAKWIPKALVINGERKEITNDVNVSRELAEEHATSGPEDATTMVEVQYGVPQVTYIAAGFVVYVVYLAIFQPHLLTALP